MTARSAYLQESIELGGAEHVAGGAGEIAGGVADSDGADDLAFAAGELEDELAVVDVLGLEDGEGRACKGAAPVDEAGVGGADGVEEGLHGGGRGEPCRRGRIYVAGYERVDGLDSALSEARVRPDLTTHKQPRRHRHFYSKSNISIQKIKHHPTPLLPLVEQHPPHLRAVHLQPELKLCVRVSIAPPRTAHRSPV